MCLFQIPQTIIINVLLIYRQGIKWHNLRSKLTPFITSPRILQAFMPALNLICDDFVELLRMRRNENGIVYNFQEAANLMGLEGKRFKMFFEKNKIFSKNFHHNSCLYINAWSSNGFSLIKSTK